MRARRGEMWKLRAQGYETRFETYCRHNGLTRVCVGCGQTYLPWRRDQRRCVAGCRRRDRPEAPSGGG